MLFRSMPPQVWGVPSPLPSRRGGAPGRRLRRRVRIRWLGLLVRCVFPGGMPPQAWGSPFPIALSPGRGPGTAPAAPGTYPVVTVVGPLLFPGMMRPGTPVRMGGPSCVSPSPGLRPGTAPAAPGTYPVVAVAGPLPISGPDQDLGGSGGRVLRGPVRGSGALFAGFFSRASIARRTAVSSCGSRPIAQSAGVMSSSTSGSTP